MAAKKKSGIEISNKLNRTIKLNSKSSSPVDTVEIKRDIRANNKTIKSYEKNHGKDIITGTITAPLRKEMKAKIDTLQKARAGKIPAKKSR